MDYNILKEKFFLGTSSLEEEDELRRYLQGDDLPEEVLEDKELLLAMLQPVEYDCREAMEEISAMIDRLAADEVAVAAADRRRAHRVVLRYLVPTVAVAAAVALFFVIAPYSDNSVVPGNAPGGAGEMVAVIVNEQPGQSMEDDSFVLCEPDLVTSSGEVDGSTVVDAEEPLLADVAKDAVKAAPGNGLQPDVLRSGNVAADAELFAALSGNDATKEVQQDKALLGKYAGALPSVDDEEQMEHNRSTVATIGNDTYTDPQDAMEHLDELFTALANIASGSVEEQRMHLKQFVVLNDK